MWWTNKRTGFLLERKDPIVGFLLESKDPIVEKLLTTSNTLGISFSNCMLKSLNFIETCTSS